MAHLQELFSLLLAKLRELYDGSWKSPAFVDHMNVNLGTLTGMGKDDLRLHVTSLRNQALNPLGPTIQAKSLELDGIVREIVLQLDNDPGKIRLEKDISELVDQVTELRDKLHKTETLLQAAKNRVRVLERNTQYHGHHEVIHARDRPPRPQLYLEPPLEPMPRPVTPSTPPPSATIVIQELSRRRSSKGSIHDGDDDKPVRSRRSSKGSLLDGDDDEPGPSRRRLSQGAVLAGDNDKQVKGATKKQDDAASAPGSQRKTKVMIEEVSDESYESEDESEDEA